MDANAPPRILIVDDEPQIRAIVAQLLSRIWPKHAQVKEADSAEAALSILEKEQFNLVITDYKMGKLTGIDLLSVAHQKYPKMGRVLVTAYNDIQIGVNAVNRGHVDGFMNKPWDNRNLLALVDSIVEGQENSPDAVPPSVKQLPRAPPQPVAATRAVAAPATSVPAELERIRNDLAEIERGLRHIRVQFGLGKISAEGYQQTARDLAAKKGILEARMLRLNGG